MSQQRRVMTRFYRSLRDHPSKLPNVALDRAVVETKAQIYDSLYEAQRDFITRCEEKGNARTFLEEDCGIFLKEFDDTGGFFGFRMGGDKVIKRREIIEEESIHDLKFPPSATQTYNGLTVTYPYSGLNSEETFIVSALHTWWIPESLNIIEKAFYGYQGAYNKSIVVSLQSLPGDTALAFVRSSMDVATGRCIAQQLVINMDYFDAIETDDPDGVSPKVGYKQLLDRVILHEMTHGVMAANMLWFLDFPAWFKEGSAELMHGTADVRSVGIEHYANHPEEMAEVLEIDYPLPNSSGVTPYIIEDDLKAINDPGASYCVGYMFLRFLAKQLAVFDKVVTYNENSIVQRGLAYELPEIADLFCDFVKLESDNVHAWDVLDTDRLSSFYGSTIRVPIYKWRKNEEDEPAYYYVSFMHEPNFSANTYNDWIFQSSNTTNYLAEAVSKYYPSGARYPSKFRADEKVIYDQGEFLAVGLHTQYDKDLYMVEQGGYCARDVTRIQDGTKHFGIMECMAIVNSSYIFGHTLAYPGTGCPMFTLSEDNKEEFNVDEYGIQYWFIKRDTDASITLRYKNGDNFPPIYQSISFGLADTQQENSHILPLFVGGPVPFYPNIRFYWPPGATQWAHKCGLTYTMDIATSSFFNSTFKDGLKVINSTETSFENEAANLLVMSPGGEWERVYSGSMAFTKNSIPVGSSRVMNAWLKYGDIDRIGNNINMIVNSSGGTNLVDTSEIFNTKHTIVDTVTDKSPLFPIIVNLDKDAKRKWPNYESIDASSTYGVEGFNGIIPNSYTSAFDKLAAGEIEINGKLYLSIPSTFDGSVWKYDMSYYFEHLTDGIYHTCDKEIGRTHMGINAKAQDDRLTREDGMLIAKRRHFLLLALED